MEEGKEGWKRGVGIGEYIDAGGANIGKAGCSRLEDRWNKHGLELLGHRELMKQLVGMSEMSASMCAVLCTYLVLSMESWEGEAAMDRSPSMSPVVCLLGIFPGS